MLQTASSLSGYSMALHGCLSPATIVCPALRADLGRAGQAGVRGGATVLLSGITPGNVRLADDVSDDRVLVEERCPVHHLVRSRPTKDGLCLARVQDRIVYLHRRQAGLSPCNRLQGPRMDSKGPPLGIGNDVLQTHQLHDTHGCCPPLVERAITPCKGHTAASYRCAA